MGKDDELGTGVWSGFGEIGHGQQIDWSEAMRKQEAFKAAERARHKARLGERRLARAAARGELADGIYGPPDPRKYWAPRPPMKR